jgi:hypothetical protein
MGSSRPAGPYVDAAMGAPTRRYARIASGPPDAHMELSGTTGRVDGASTRSARPYSDGWHVGPKGVRRDGLAGAGGV